MTEWIYAKTDMAVLWLWTWFGVRRRWLIAAAFVLGVPEHLRHRFWTSEGMLNFVWLITAGIWALSAFAEEMMESPDILNLMARDRRKRSLSKAFLWTFVGLGIADAVFVLGGRGSLWTLVGTLGFVAFWLFKDAQVPTTPRKRWHMPQLFPLREAVRA